MQKASPKCLQSCKEVLRIFQNSEFLSGSDGNYARGRRREVNCGEKSFLLARLTGSKQSLDLTLPPNCNGFGRIHHFRAMESTEEWVGNPLPMAPASDYLGIPANELTEAQVFQLGSCNFDCWFCYVDRSLRSANLEYCDYVTAPELLYQLHFEERDAPRIIDLSGGQPDLAPEYTLWFLEAREQMGLEDDYFIWVDDNLSSYNLWKYLDEDQIAYMAHKPGFARVGCLKGFDDESFAFNTGTDSEIFDRQIEILGKLVAAGFDQYGYVILTTQNLDHLQLKMGELFDRLQDISPNLPLRIIPLEIRRYGVNSKLFFEQAAQNQFVALEAWQTELKERYRPWQLRQPITRVRL